MLTTMESYFDREYWWRRREILGVVMSFLNNQDF